MVSTELGSKTIGTQKSFGSQNKSAGENRNNSQNLMQLPQNNDKLLITGDDVLIEYVSRLMIALKSIRENAIKP